MVTLIKEEKGYLDPTKVEELLGVGPTISTDC